MRAMCAKLSSRSSLSPTLSSAQTLSGEWSFRKFGITVAASSGQGEAMAMSVPGPIVTARWLKKALASVRAGNPKITVVDGSYILPKRDLRKAWEDSRIPGARFFDIDAVCDSTTQSTSSTCRGSAGACFASRASTSTGTGA